MTPAEQAAKVIKDATGWDASLLTDCAKVSFDTGVHLFLRYSRVVGTWSCQCDGHEGGGDTPEAALNNVLPRYRAHIASLAADILPGWPRLEWEAPFSEGGSRRLMFRSGEIYFRVLSVFADKEGWFLGGTLDGLNPDVCGNREVVLAWVKAHVESLALPCPLPPFPETPDA